MSLLDLLTSIAALTTFLTILILLHFWNNFSFFHANGIFGNLSR